MVVNKRIHAKTQGHCDIIDITQQIKAEIENSEIENGIMTVFVSGSTAAISTIENESGLLSDFKAMWNRNVPADIPYAHHRALGENNGFSHVRASLLGASFTVPVVNKKMTLGTWQQIVLVDFDNRSRSREIILQLIGE